MLDKQRRNKMRRNTGQVFKMWCLWCVGALAIAGCAHFNKGDGTEVQQTPAAQIQPQTQENTTPVELKEEKIEAVPTPDYYVHTVKWRGETLSYIAKWYTGKYKNWKILAEANPTLNPNRIHKGDKIIIPDGVLNTRTPLPKNFLAKFTSSRMTKQTSVKPSGQPEGEKAIPLFGPKEN
jgi:hypothetical protein